jgi:hypothetical protein
MALGKSKFSGLVSAPANGTAASRTVELTDLDHARKVGIGVALVRVAGTVLTLTAWKSADGGTTWFKVPGLSSQGDGSFEALDYSVFKTVSGDDSLWLTVDMEDANALKYLVAVTTGGATDLISSQACASWEGV